MPGYSYSDALDGSDIVWSDETIDELFDLGPEHYIPGTKMPMQRIAGAAGPGRPDRLSQDGNRRERIPGMKTMLLAFVTVFGIAIAADVLLHRAGWSIADRTSGDAVRLD